MEKQEIEKTCKNLRENCRKIERNIDKVKEILLELLSRCG